MLEEFRVDNFKSLINVTLRPRARNLLIGVNNAGKTNLCQALRFLSASTFQKLDDCASQVVGSRFALTNHYFAKPTIDFRVKATVPVGGEEVLFEYDLTVLARAPSFPMVPLEVEKETLRATGGGLDGVVLLENTRDGAGLLHEPDHLQGRPAYHRASPEREATFLSRVFDSATNPRTMRFKSYLAAWQYYALSPTMLRGFMHAANVVILEPDGKNLASVLFQLKTADERKYRELLSHLQKLDPTIELINFSGPTDNVIHMSFEDVKRQRLDVSSMSDGTLRFLGLIYVLFAQPMLALNPLIMIEEPENGIYVGFLKQLLEMLEEVARPAQVVFTSHSPYFIDLFEEHLDSIFVLKRDEQHSSIVQLDVEQVKNRLERFPLGEQHFREMLG